MLQCKLTVQFLLPVSSETVTRLCLFMRKRDLFVAPIKIKLLSVVLVLVYNKRN